MLRSDPPDVYLTIEAKMLADGEAAMAGRTNLPDNTELTALALRYLSPTKALGRSAQPTFAILDYQTTTVEKSQWAAELDLWRVADDGHYQEAWQVEVEQLGLGVEPDEAVYFVITLAPQEFLSALNRDLRQDRLQLPPALVRTTESGEALLWSDATLEVDIPRGPTAPPADLAQRDNGGWGERYRLVPEPSLPYTLTPDDERKTTAPPAPAEFLQ